jgi:hypothetical protein
MKFSDDMRFAYPVLSAETGDFTEGHFTVDTFAEEIVQTGQLSIRYNIYLTEPSIRALVENGDATVGLFVRCQDTFYSQLIALDWPKGTIEFEAGLLLHRVSMRPVIWLSRKISEWTPVNVHPEFTLPIIIGVGDILAIDYEQTFPVGQAKLAAMESIFALAASHEQAEGRLSVKLDSEKITILADDHTYKVINSLRHSHAKTAIMTSVYMPAVMEVLDALRGDSTLYDSRRWKQTFADRCTAAGIDYDGSLFENAQTLLTLPVSRLEEILEQHYEKA